MEKVFKIVRYWFWDRWHGESVSFFDTRRAIVSEAPVVKIGSLRIPRWVFYVLGALLVLLVLGFIAARLTGVTFISESALRENSVLTITGDCFAHDQLGRQFVALDCLWRQYVGSLIKGIPAVLTGFLIFVAGFVCGWYGHQYKKGD